MKTKLYTLLLIILCFSCSDEKNSDEFINNTTGRYLFNANEVIEIHFEEQVLFAKWRGKENIKPLKLDENSFYMSEMNEKLVFLDNPKRIELEEKTEHKGVKYIFEKLAENEKTPNEYIKASEFDKAFEAFKTIKDKDSLNPVIRERSIRDLAGSYNRKNDHKKAIEIYKINTKLYPKRSRAFSALGYGYWQDKDTVNAIASYKKALTINAENRWATRFFKEHKFD